MIVNSQPRSCLDLIIKEIRVLVPPSKRSIAITGETLLSDLPEFKTDCFPGWIERFIKRKFTVLTIVTEDEIREISMVNDVYALVLTKLRVRP